MPLPIIPTSTITQADYWRLDLEIRKAGEERCQESDTANLVQRKAEDEAIAAYRAAMLAQEATRTTALQAQSAAQIRLAEAASIPDKGWTDADLVRTFMASLIQTWGGGTTPTELIPIAQSMVTAYRKLYPITA